MLSKDGGRLTLEMQNTVTYFKEDGFTVTGAFVRHNSLILLLFLVFPLLPLLKSLVFTLRFSAIICLDTITV